MQVKKIHKADLASLAADGWPNLKRGMVITVHRPWSWRSPLWSLMAWRIREHSSRLTGRPANEHHAMIYAGNGKCWSQDSEFDLVKMSDYPGCRLTFFSPPFSLDECNDLIGECAPHKGRKYGYSDLLGYLAWSITGSEKMLEWLSDKRDWHCSEAVCRLMRKVMPGAFSPGSCEKKHPQALYDWMQGQAWPRVEMWIN
jgi:hypothetical protein